MKFLNPITLFFALAIRASPLSSDIEQRDLTIEQRNLAIQHRDLALRQRDLLNDLNLTIPAVPADQCTPSSPKGIQPGCWQALDMNNYLSTWWQNNGATCNSTNRGFAQCYLDMAGLITWSCDFININGCSPPPSGPQISYHSPQEFYTVWNIYAINLFFTNYQQGLMQGQAAAIGAVAEIVKVVAPPVKKNTATPKIGPIVGTAIGLIGAFGPAVGMLGVPVVIPFLLILAPLGNVGGFASILFPAETVSPVPWEGLSEALGNQVNDFQKNIGKALNAVQTDFNIFFGLTSSGLFSQKLPTKLPENTDYMYHSLLKWTFNSALEANNYFVVKNPGVDPTKIPIEAYDCSKLDKFGTCGPIWYDGSDSYGLARVNDIGMDRMEEILKTAFAKNWTTPHELYIDAQKCRARNSTEEFDIHDLSLTCLVSVAMNLSRRLSSPAAASL
ncbi:uncharacterized protein LY79DRAFT_574233 [Colletotrichum navitas]|uniref:LysM domain-containing protein n=1 Tax=Colletotrichum navitas TaxID=681940 RepID=A0AAD8UXL2_9PEZI|nr:uncharacterized protein LY79DRAFT_574233 [Colletotrichum navitas]KAK1561440.1 hypothetical protein LY79DRAFT_574233 [Colletotrichum navitas]